MTDASSTRRLRMNFPVACGMVSLCLLGCASSAPDAEHESNAKPATSLIVVTSYPLFEMVSEIVGDEVGKSLTLLLVNPPDGASGQWMPGDDDIQRLQSADLIFLSGAGYEPWTANVSLPRSRTVDTSVAYRNQLISVSGTVTHQHGPLGADTEGQFASETWLDPRLALHQLQAVESQLLHLLPDHSSVISRRTAILAETFGRLDAELSELAQHPSAPKIVFSQTPRYAYLVQRLGSSLQVVPSTADRDSFAAASAPDLAEGLEAAKGSALFFTQKPPTSDLQQFLAEHQVPIVIVELCTNVSSDASLADRMKNNITAIRNAVDSVEQQ